MAIFTITPPEPFEGQTIEFNASLSYDIYNRTINYFWEFRDWTTGVLLWTGNWGDNPIMTWTSLSEGTYNVTLTVTVDDPEYPPNSTSSFLLVRPQQHYLVIGVVGSGTTNPAPGTHMADEGSSVKVTAYPDDGWALDYWLLDGDVISVGFFFGYNPYYVTMNADHNLTAVFKRVYTLSISVVGEGTTYPMPVPWAYVYDAGTSVEVTAYATLGPTFVWILDHWLLDGVNVSQSNSIPVEMNQDHDLTAVFVRIEFDPPAFTFNLTVSVDGGGTTIPDSGTHIYPAGENTTVVAIPNPDAPEQWELDHWLLDGEKIEPGTPSTFDRLRYTWNYTVVMDNHHNLTAVFSQVPLNNITISTVGSGTTDPTPGDYSWYTPSFTYYNLTVYASPDSGWVLDHWLLDDANVDPTNSILVNMDVSHTLTAVFIQVDSAALTVSVSPRDLSVEVGQSGVFTATVSGGTPPYTYRWYEGSTIVGDADTLTISKNTAGTYRFYCIVSDEAISTATSNEVTLQVSSPLTVSVSPRDLSVEVGQSGVFTATVSGGTPPYTYRWYEESTIVGDADTLTISKSAAGTYQFYCEVSDSTGETLNSNTVTFTTKQPGDYTPPQTEIRLSGTSGENGWYTSEVFVALSASDDFGVLAIGYSFDNVAWLTYTSPFAITSDGRITVYYNSTDTSLNVEATKTKEVKIDKEPPTGTLIIEDGAEYTNNTEVMLALSASDLTSGMFQMRLSNDDWEYSPWRPCEASCLWTLQDGTGQKTVYVQFKDQAGLRSTFSDSIILSTQKAEGIPLEYIAVPTAVAVVSAAAYALIRTTRRRLPSGEEKMKVLSPLFKKLRWIQAQVFEMQPGEKQRIRRVNALRANALHSLDVRVGPADKEWLTPPEESVFPEEKLTWKNGVSHLQVVFSESNHSPIPQTREIVLPREGSSTTCQFTFSTRGEVPYFKGRVIVLHRNRVLQTALLEGRVVPEPAQYLDSKLQFAVESIIQPDLSNLATRRDFDLSFVTNHSMNNSATVITIAHEQAFFNPPDNIQKPIKEITKELERVVAHPDDFPKSMDDRKNVRWLLKLAIKGRELYEGIVVDQIGEQRLRKINRIQLVSTVDGYLPLEFFYDMPTPKFNARLCPKWHEALENSDEKLVEGLCKDCAIKDSVSPVEFLCPLGFWGLRLIVERHYIDPYDKPDLKGYRFALRGEPPESRRPLKVLKSAIFAASEKVDKVVPQTQDVFRALQEATRKKTKHVTTLKSWRDAVKKLQPSLLVLLTHISPCDLNPEEPQMEIGKGVGLPKAHINRNYILPSENAPRPVVLILGCTTLSTDITFRGFAAKFRREGAAIVLSTITDVLGRHVAPVSAQLVENLQMVTEKGLSLGDALVLVRRKALVDGIPMVLCLVGIGDADWRFETMEAN